MSFIGSSNNYNIQTNTYMNQNNAEFEEAKETLESKLNKFY